MVESIFNFEITAEKSAVSAVFADFYAALYRLTENPCDPEVRQAVIGSATNMTSIINQIADKLRDQYNDINEEIDASVRQINAITRSIADLNNQIFSYELSGAKANDLKDKRNMLLDELAGYIPIKYHQTSEGYLVVEHQGVEIIRHADQKDFAVTSSKDHAFTPGAKVYEMYLAEQIDETTGAVLTDPNTSAPFTPLEEKQGIMGAYFKMRDGDDDSNIGIPYVMHMFDKLCQKIAREFNAVHMQGWSLPNGTELSKQGNKFFKDGIGDVQKDASGNITGYWLEGQDPLVDPMITGNPYEDPNAFSGIRALDFAVDDSLNPFSIAASSEEIVTGADNEQRNNNINALKLVELLTKVNASGNPDNFDSAYKEILVAVGLEMSHISRMNENQTVVLANIEDKRKSVSDVSIDEEVTNLIKYGHSYNAASRVITAIDEELDTIINKMGLVGR